MKLNKLLVWGAAIALIAAAVTACCSESRGEGGENNPELELRSYVVPPEYASEVNSVINSLLGVKVKLDGAESTLGRSRIGPGGLVLVTAPKSVHTGIRVMLEELQNKKPVPPPTVSITYWMVVGRPSAKTQWPSNLNEIGPALETVASSDAPMSYELREKMVLGSLSGENAGLSGNTMTIRQQATVHGGTVLGNIEINGRPRSQYSIDTTVQIGLDTLLVLGQSGLGSEDARIRDAGGNTSGSLFFVIKASMQ